MKQVQAIILLFMGAVCIASCSPKTISKYLFEKPSFKATVVDSLSIPYDYKYPGKLQMALHWIDKKGKNYLICSLTDEKIEAESSNSENDGLEVKTRVLGVFHFVDSTLLWKSIHQANCPYDITLGFIEKAISITDIDNDSIAEIVFVCNAACASDVSPRTISLEMREDGKKYYLDGVGQLPGANAIKEQDICCANNFTREQTEKDWTLILGKYNNEKGFERAPEGFLAHARKVWVNAINNEYNYLNE